MYIAPILPALYALLLHSHRTYSLPFEDFPEKLTHHHLLAIRDAPSHVPIQAMAVRPGVFLEHLRKMNPNLKPVLVEQTGKYEISQWSFNNSMWNSGLADYLANPRTSKSFTMDDVKQRMQSANANTTHHNKRENNAVYKDFQDGIWQPYDQEKETKPQPVAGWYARDSKAAGGIKEVTIRPRASYFTEGVYMKLDELRETANALCRMFDSHMFQFATGSNNPGDIKQFSMGTVYKAVKLDNDANAHVNFIFNFHPAYSWDNEHYWWSMSIFTGIQGMCWRFLGNFLTVETAPDGLVGGATPADTRGGWVGFGNGKNPDDNGEKAWRVRWAIDPYSPMSKEEPTPKQGTGEDDNGVPYSDPSV
ncbi:hypothetical protein TWF696_008888 [Orbilia brochopaga]|uniref:Uncharacterized protein n=1 Tax=Orbilia brochopaga TaxID=3140254 RepID=A0AAV9UE92_9PEZI